MTSSAVGPTATMSSVLARGDAQRRMAGVDRAGLARDDVDPGQRPVAVVGTQTVSDVAAGVPMPGATLMTPTTPVRSSL